MNDLKEDKVKHPIRLASAVGSYLHILEDEGSKALIPESSRHILPSTDQDSPGQLLHAFDKLDYVDIQKNVEKKSSIVSINCADDLLQHINALGDNKCGAFIQMRDNKLTRIQTTKNLVNIAKLTKHTHINNDLMRNKIRDLNLRFIDEGSLKLNNKKCRTDDEKQNKFLGKGRREGAVNIPDSDEMHKVGYMQRMYPHLSPLMSSSSISKYHTKSYIRSNNRMRDNDMDSRLSKDSQIADSDSRRDAKDSSRGTIMPEPGSAIIRNEKERKFKKKRGNQVYEINEFGELKQSNKSIFKLFNLHEAAINSPALASAYLSKRKKLGQSKHSQMKSKLDKEFNRGTLKKSIAEEEKEYNVDLGSAYNKVVGFINFNGNAAKEDSAKRLQESSFYYQNTHQNKSAASIEFLQENQNKSTIGYNTDHSKKIDTSILPRNRSKMARIKTNSNSPVRKFRALCKLRIMVGATKNPIETYEPFKNPQIPTRAKLIIHSTNTLSPDNSFRSPNIGRVQNDGELSLIPNDNLSSPIHQHDRPKTSFTLSPSKVVSVSRQATPINIRPYADSHAASRITVDGHYTPAHAMFDGRRLHRGYARSQGIGRPSHIRSFEADVAEHGRELAVSSISSVLLSKYGCGKPDRDDLKRRCPKVEKFAREAVIKIGKKRKRKVVEDI